MWDFIKRWHPLILLVIGIYLAVPKPAPNPAEIDSEFLARYDTNDSGDVTRDEFPGPDFDTRDVNRDGRLTVGSTFRWPLHEYRWNLGQDLKGGSSLRYELRQQDLLDAERSLRELLEPLESARDRLPQPVVNAFGRVMDGGELRLGEWSEAEFALLHDLPAIYDEGRADALQNYYRTWSDAKRRRDDANLVGPTIDTLNRRLGTIGITELNIVQVGENRIEVKLPEFSTAAETNRYKQLLETTGRLEMRVLASEDSEFTNLQVGDTSVEDGYKYRWLELARPDAVGSQNLVKERDGVSYVPVQIIDNYNITGANLTNIQPTQDQQGGMAVSFDLRGLAVARFEALTSLHKEAAAGGEDPRLLAIIIDDKVFSAYNIKDTISGSVQLSGRFTSSERDDIINVLRSGSLNVQLVMEGEETVGPSEGADAVRRGLWSLVIGAIAVFLFALLIYRGLGLLMIFNLVIVVTLLLGALSAGLGTLTMPGIAGIVLTIGMAIDASILINERIREEREKQLNMRGAVEEGFRNALSAIVDANVTTLITAIILYKIGSGPIQGFALTLAIGIVATLYAALGAYRAMVFAVLNIKRDVQFKMAGLKFARDRNIDWMRWMRYGAIAALLLVLGGGSFIVTHGNEVLGMEFRGGHTFRIQMNQPYERDEIEAVVRDPETGQPRFEWAESIGIQPIYRLGTDLGGGLADRFDFRFPLSSEWQDEEPEVITNRLQAHLEEQFADRMVEEGWHATTADLTEVTLEARFTLALKDAEAFREAFPDDFDSLWLSQDSAWLNDPSAPRTYKDRWFGELMAGDIESRMTPRRAGERQEMMVRATAVPVGSADESARKFEDFKNSIRRYFWEDSQHVVLDGEPSYTSFPTAGRLEVRLTLLEPIDAEVFRGFLEGLPMSSTGELSNTSLTVNAQSPEDGMARGFVIRSQPMTFSPDPTSASHFSQVETELSTAISEWLQGYEDGTNEISRRFLLSSAIGPTVAGESRWRALFAIIAALIVVVIYIRIRFASLAWGVSAVIALLHDSFVVIGLIGLADYLGADIKIDLTVVAAILTVIGYSLNDTIINFDRIRENLKNDRLATGGKTPLKDIVNTSINQMLSRTVMTSTTTLLTTIAMLIFGGPLLKGFAFAMTCGIIVGTFSSIYLAGPILVFFDKRTEGSLLDLTSEEAPPEPEAKSLPAADEAGEPGSDNAKPDKQE